MRTARLMAKRSTCLRKQVGAVIVKNHRLVASGYNGAPAGHPHCLDIGCSRENTPHGENYEICKSVHAETNALLQAGIDRCKGATIYTTLFPCNLCAKEIANTGISKVVYEEDFVTSTTGKNLLQASGIAIAKWGEEEEMVKLTNCTHCGGTLESTIHTVSWVEETCVLYDINDVPIKKCGVCGKMFLVSESQTYIAESVEKLRGE